MRKELQEVREILEQIDEGDYRYIEGSEIYDDVSKALATLDRILGQGEAEIIESVAKSLWDKQKDLLGDVWFHPSETWEGLPYGAQEEWFVLAKTALRAVGMIKENE